MTIQQIENSLQKRIRKNTRTWKAWELLKNGHKLTSLGFFKITGDMNLRSKISVLKKNGAPISSRKVGGKNQGFYKEYFLDFNSIERR